MTDQRTPDDRLRELAEKANASRSENELADWPMWPEQEFADAASPSVVLALLDRLRAPLDVERLYRAMVAADSDEPGVFNIVAISEPDTRPVAAFLAAVYAALSEPLSREPREPR